jgi:hypothetical protein
MSTTLEVAKPSAVSEEEELRVTYQVGMVGCDGILFASDTRQIYVITPTEQNPYPPFQPSEVSKFLLSADRSLICAFAGSPLSREFAKRIVAATGSHSSSALDLERDFLDISAAIGPPMGSRDEIMVARASDPSRILLLSRWVQRNSATDQTRWITTGDNSGPCRFFLHHFYEKRPIAELQRLAALTLAYASMENPTGIGGIEMWTVTEDGIKQIDHATAAREAEQARLEIELSIRSGLYPINS